MNEQFLENSSCHAVNMLGAKTCNFSYCIMAVMVWWMDGEL